MRTERWILDWRNLVSATASPGLLVPAGGYRRMTGATKGRVYGEMRGLVNSPSVIPAIDWANQEGTPLGTATKLLPSSGTTAWNAAQLWAFDSTNPWQTLGNSDIYLLGRPAFYVLSAAGGTIASCAVWAAIDIEFG